MYNQFYPYMMGTVPNATRMASPLMGAARTSPLSSLLGARSATPMVSALGGATKASTFTFTGLLNGASKTLGVINQAIPVFYQVKPIINNAKTMYRVAKEINSNDRKNNTNNSNNVSNKINDSNDVNKPNFFI
jgi:hypothetical protein